MGRTITKAVALGVLPSGFTLLAYLVTRGLLFWPKLAASLWGAAVWLILFQIGLKLVEAFLAGGAGWKCEPREVGRFLGRLMSLHTLGAFGVAASYALAAELLAGHWYGQWLSCAAALLGGSMSFALFFWILFPSKDPYRGGRLILEGARLRQEAKKYERELKGAKEPRLFFAGHGLEFDAARSHFLVMGATNTGKSLVLQMLMESVLPNIGLGLDQRAVVFDAKQDMPSHLAGMKLKCPIILLDAFDKRARAWDMAVDIKNRLDAQTLAENLVPIDEHANQKFFDESVRSLYEEVVVTFQKTAPGVWTFRDVILTMQDPKLLTRVLKRTRAGRRRLALCFANVETGQNIVATINNRTKPYEAIASAWYWASKEGRTISLTKWLTEESILVLGNSHTARPAVQAVNQVLFTRLAELILSQKDSATRATWMIFDEVRQAGPLKKLTDLMVEGRSKGASVALGFQDMAGMMHVHKPNLAKELVWQAHNVCITKLVNPETAELAAKMFGEHEAIEEDESITKSSGGGRSRTVSVKIVRRQAVMASELMSIPMPTPKAGLTFYAMTSKRLKAYHETMPGKAVAAKLSPPNSDPATGGMVDSDPISDDRLELQPWDEADYVRLKMKPPRKKASAKEQKPKEAKTQQPQKQPENKPEESEEEERCRRGPFRLIEGGDGRRKQKNHGG